MIRLKENLSGISEPFMGSEISSLFKAFNKQTDRLSLYETSEGSVLLRFGRRLLISGKVNFEELLAFSDVMGIKTIEGLYEDFDYIPQSASFYSIMEIGENIPSAPSPIMAEDMKVPFEILRKSDEHFKENALYDYWLSDIRRMEREGLLNVFLKDNASTASVIARGFGKSLIGQVATLPEERGKGLASALLSEICNFEKKMGGRAFLISKNRILDGFYENLGFTKQKIKTIISI